MPRARSWTDDQLIDVVAGADTWSDVVRGLGLTHGGRTYGVLRARAVALDIDTSHLLDLVDGRPRTRRRFTDEELSEAVARCNTLSAVMRTLGYEPSGGMHRFIKAHVERLGLDTTHFVGQGWARGLAGRGGFNKRPLEELLVKGSSIGGSRLLRRLMKEGLKEPSCEECQRARWRGQPIPLHLDHINGDPTDNRLENVRALCPNCHALTPTYCGRNRGRVAELAYAQVLGTCAERHESSNLSAPTITDRSRQIRR